MVHNRQNRAVILGEGPRPTVTRRTQDRRRNPTELGDFLI